MNQVTESNHQLDLVPNERMHDLEGDEGGYRKLDLNGIRTMTNKTCEQRARQKENNPQLIQMSSRRLR